MKIIKVDLLGLGMMAVLEDSLDLVPRHYKEPLDLAQLGQDDPEVYRALRWADGGDVPGRKPRRPLPDLV